MPSIQTIDPAAKTVLISKNPKSGAGNRSRLVSRLAERLSQDGFDVQVIQDIELLCDQVDRALTQRTLRTVVSAGGDGTVSLLVNRLPAEVPFTVFPLGTANLLAKHYDASTNIEKVVATIANGSFVALDVGKANDKLFLVVASCGFDADVVSRLHTARTGHISYWSYMRPVFDSIFKYRFPKMRLVADGDQELKPACWAFVLNVPQYAIDLKFVEAADGHDGKLDLCLFEGAGFWTGLYYFFAVLLRKHKHLKASQFARFKSLSITNDDSQEQIPVQLDGDPAGYLPLKIQVVPDRFRVVVSESWLAKNH